VAAPPPPPPDPETVLRIEELAAKLDDADGNVVFDAGVELAGYGDRRAAYVLMESLRDESAEVRRAAAAALGNIREIMVVRPLVEALQDEDESVRTYAQDSLQKVTGWSLHGYDAWSRWLSEHHSGG
jgi:HEAT repeat protein